MSMRNAPVLFDLFYIGDWSSDVCSSDLNAHFLLARFLKLAHPMWADLHSLPRFASLVCYVKCRLNFSTLSQVSRLQVNDEISAAKHSNC